MLAQKRYPSRGSWRPDRGSCVSGDFEKFCDRGPCLSDNLLLSRILDEDVAALKASGAFDEEWYVNEYPDVRQSGIDPARHYLWLGVRLGRKPSAGQGAAPAVLAQPVPVVEQAPPPAPPAPEETRDMGLIDKARKLFAPRRDKTGDSVYDLVAEHFDEDFYLTTYPDVAAAGVDPIRHYLEAGWHEQRDPSLHFSTRFYAENNPDVISAGVNPFYHFIVAGKAEGRPGRHQLGFRWDILARLKPVAEQIRDFKSHRAPPSVTPLDVVEKLLSRGMAGANKVVLSFSHDDFTRNVGGIQLLLRRVMRLFRERGYTHIHVFPEFPLPFLDTSNDEISLGILVDGELAGYVGSRSLPKLLARNRPALASAKFIVHSLLGHNMDHTIEMLEAFGTREGVMWLHDFSSIYNNFTLLRNDVEYRGFPKPGTLARDLCEYGRADFCHAREFGKLFDRFQPTVVAPSQATLKIFTDARVLQPRATRIVEHVTLIDEPPPLIVSSTERGPLRVGYLGFPATHKGWPVFRELVLEFGDDPRYEFYHLGKGRVGGLNAKFIEVEGTEHKPDAMREAVARAGLDVAILWSICPETFCLTAYEAIAAGAFVISNPDAVNIVAAIERTGQGKVLQDEQALYDALVNAELARYARSQRSVRHYGMRYSDLSLEVLD